MNKSEFLDFIGDINKKRAALFTTEVKEKINYNDININSENATANEKEIIEKCKKLDSETNIAFEKTKNLSDYEYDLKCKKILKLFNELKELLQKL